ncbi:MAG: serine hydrolase [Sarcina sp.]
MKNLFKAIFSGLMLVCIFGITSLATEVPDVTAEGMVLIDATTGTILADKNSKERFAPASTTKVMTALLTLENTKLNDVVTVGEKPPFADGSRIGLKEGDKYTVEHLLYSLLLESANDSAMSLAEHIAGSEEEFAKLMTKRAKELGATDTNFMNASGLPDDNHYTTAIDLALIMKEVIKHPEYIKISQVLSYELPASIVDGQTKWVNNSTTMYNPNNSNYFPELIAAKTGYTDIARSTYVAAAKKEEQMLISVLLKSENKVTNFKDTKALMAYGFDNFDLLKLYNKGDEITSITVNDTNIPLLASKDVYHLVNNSLEPLSRGNKDSNNVKTSLNLEQKDLSKLSFNEGDNILSADILVDNKVITTLPLLSGVTIEHSSFSKIFSLFKSNIFLAVLGLILVLVVIFIIKEKLFYNKYRRRTKKIIFKSKNKIKW